MSKAPAPAGKAWERNSASACRWPGRAVLRQAPRLPWPSAAPMDQDPHAAARRTHTRSLRRISKISKAATYQAVLKPQGQPSSARFHEVQTEIGSYDFIWGFKVI